VVSLQEVEGVVKRVEPYGLFIQLSDSIATGLVHISEVSDKRIHKLEASYPVGRRVRVVVLDIDADKGRLSLGMKDKYFVSKDAGEKGNRGDGDEQMEDVEAADRTGVVLPRFISFVFLLR
jgi:rRNA biogenesis protein RRP5